MGEDDVAHDGVLEGGRLAEVALAGPQLDAVGHVPAGVLHGDKAFVVPVGLALQRLQQEMGEHAALVKRN